MWGRVGPHYAKDVACRAVVALMAPLALPAAAARLFVAVPAGAAALGLGAVVSPAGVVAPLAAAAVYWPVAGSVFESCEPAAVLAVEPRAERFAVAASLRAAGSPAAQAPGASCIVARGSLAQAAGFGAAVGAARPLFWVARCY